MNSDEPLPSWNDGAARRAILEFVTSVSRPGTSYVPPVERIATFDNDGTLWCEKPQYAQADFAIRRWRQMAEADPDKAAEQPYKAVVENDQAWLGGLLDHVPDLLKGVAEAYGGITSSRSTTAPASRCTSGCEPAASRFWPVETGTATCPCWRLRASAF